MMKPLSTSNPLASIILLSTLLTSTTTAQKFDPYQLNGGLVAAVAGRDYVLIASDTRLTDGGYGVHSRRYLSGRLWSASSSSSTSSPVEEVADPLVSSSCDDDIIALSINNDLVQPPSTTTTSNVHWDFYGSLQLPSIISPNSASSSSLQTIEPTNTHSISIPTTTTTNPPIMIGSAGCASDCESLKRRVRLELDALTMNNNNSNSKLGVASVANLLQQILYSRRGFPFYSFCVVAGLHTPQELALLDGDDGRGKKRMEGAVYVYDAIGSYERVAVGSAGTGRELLQPILDQLFSDGGTTTIISKDDDPSRTINNNDNHSNNGKSGDIMAIPPMKQRVGVAGSLRPPVQTVVRCSVEDAVRNVARAYQSVAEREISVGDEVVICVVKSSDVVASSAGGGGGHGGRKSEGAVLKVYRYPLKKH